ncbi:MAG: aminotransferase class IV [Planctomycetota bacterium]
MQTRWAYLNGQWRDDRDLSMPIGDLGFTLGVTATERLRTFGGKVFRQAEHMERMRRSLAIIGLDAEAITAELDKAVSEFVERNASRLPAGSDWSIAAFATPGDGRSAEQGGGPNRCVHGNPLPFANWASQFDEGVSVYLSDHRQTPASCWPPELKCRSRMHYYLADQQARRREPGARAILLDQDGFVGEASTANVVIYRQGEGVVSPRMEKVLPGVSVAVVRELCDRLGIAFTERDLTIEELRTADEAWLSSTSICLLPVVRCDGEPIAGGQPGPVYRSVLAAWSELVGVDVAEQARAIAWAN